MKKSNHIQPTFKGIIPPMITPLLDADTLDIKGLEKLIDHILAGGVHGLFILGTTGESTSLSYKIRHELIEKTCAIVNNRVPVFVGITDTAAVESLKLAETAAKAKASAVVAAPPYYFNLGQAELIEYYQYLSERLPLPLFLYNMPSHTKIMIEPDTVEILSELKNIVGLKDSSANSVYFNKVLYKMKDRPDFSLLVGPEEIMAESVLLGGHGGVNGGANLFPSVYVNLYNSAISGNLEEVRKYHRQVMEISTKLYSVGSFGSSYLKGLKAALSIMEICSDYMASPLHSFRSTERELVERNLMEIRKNIK